MAQQENGRESEKQRVPGRNPMVRYGVRVEEGGVLPG